ncbi:MAG: alcohol dehydrogenase catalytic domain-containing protein [Acutalibacteraceae bacterium]
MVFPRTSGYNSAGIVVKKGADVKNVDIGDRVVVYWGQHKSYNTVPEGNVVKIEDECVSFETAAMSFISTFPMAAIRKTRLEMGEVRCYGTWYSGCIAVKLCAQAGSIAAANPGIHWRCDCI